MSESLCIFSIMYTFIHKIYGPINFILHKIELNLYKYYYINIQDGF
jgi:hypothetical protein